MRLQWMLSSTLLLHLAVILRVVLAARSKVVLVSMDGFRYDYLTKARTPNFDKMVAAGVTMPYMNNTFITSTFSCHYSMATGLYPESHGIVGNRMYDPVFDAYFKMSTQEPRWWEGGEPIWTTARKAGLKTGTYFWPGSEVSIQGIRPTKWFQYNTSTPFVDRVQTVIRWMSEDDFDLGLLYFHEPDSSGHAYGPDNASLIPVIETMDDVLGSLIQGLDNAHLKDKVNVIVTSDHGMTSIDLQNKLVDLSLYTNKTLLHSLVDYGATSQIRPQPGKDQQLLDSLSGIEHMQVMLKENIPERFHFKNNRRVMPLFAIADEGWYITGNGSITRTWGTKGGHGYDNNILSMKPIFIARGPAFKSGVTVDPIKSVDIYVLICYLLEIPPAPNNGSLERAATLLKHFGNTAAQSIFSTHLVWILMILWLLK